MNEMQIARMRKKECACGADESKAVRRKHQKTSKKVILWYDLLLRCDTLYC